MKLAIEFLPEGGDQGLPIHQGFTGREDLVLCWVVQQGGPANGVVDQNPRKKTRLYHLLHFKKKRLKQHNNARLEWRPDGVNTSSGLESRP